MIWGHVYNVLFEKKIIKFSPFLQEYFENINFIEMPIILNLGGFDIL